MVRGRERLLVQLPASKWGYMLLLREWVDTSTKKHVRFIQLVFFAVSFY